MFSFGLNLVLSSKSAFPWGVGTKITTKSFKCTSLSRKTFTHWFRFVALIYLFVCLFCFVYLFICLFIHLFIYLFTYISTRYKHFNTVIKVVVKTLWLNTELTTYWQYFVRCIDEPIWLRDSLYIRVAVTYLTWLKLLVKFNHFVFVKLSQWNAEEISGVCSWDLYSTVGLQHVSRKSSPNSPGDEIARWK